MSLADLKTITLRREETANFTVMLLLLEGVGYEVRWQQNRDAKPGNYAWAKRGSGVIHKLARAEAEYAERHRLICIAEAKLALGLLS